MKNTKIATIIFAATLTPLTAIADTPDWNIIEAGYSQATIDGIDEFEPGGFSLTGSRLLGENVFIAARYFNLSDELSGIDIDLNQLSIGVGYRHGITDSTDIYGAVSYEQIEAEVSGYGQSENEDESGHGITVGVRSRLTEAVELNGSIGYVDIDGESETMLGASMSYYFTPQTAIGLNYSAADDVDVVGVSVRFAF